jgi:very-short-patch-repair endonuclease
MYSKDFYNKNLRDVARQLRKHMTPFEKKIWFDFLRYLKPGVRRQRPMGKFIVDFYIPKAKLVIEIDGDVHMNEKAIAKDQERTDFFNSLGIHVLRIKNEEISSSFQSVCNIISQTILERL